MEGKKNGKDIAFEIKISQPGVILVWKRGQAVPVSLIKRTKEALEDWVGKIE